MAYKMRSENLMIVCSRKMTNNNPFQVEEVVQDDLSDELSHEFLDSLVYVMLPVSPSFFRIHMANF